MPERSPRRAGVSVGLTRADVWRTIDEWRTLGTGQFRARFHGHPAVRYRVVEGDDTMDALALLVGARHLAGLDVEAAYRGDRVNVAEPLRRLGFFVESTAGVIEPVVDPTSFNFAEWLSRLAGNTDRPTRGTSRREQAVLRTLLMLDRPEGAHCGLCVQWRPPELLRAAHIKPRRHCSFAERTDAPWIAMSACLLGCDALFELGYLAVNELGMVIASADCPVEIVSMPAPSWCEQRAHYFAWHHQHQFRG